MSMSRFSCPECAAIDRELREAALALRQRRTEQQMTYQDLADWLRHLDEDECARMRETSTLWSAWRKLRDHMVLTGHSVSLIPLPPDAIMNPN